MVFHWTLHRCLDCEKHKRNIFLFFNRFDDSTLQQLNSIRSQTFFLARNSSQTAPSGSQCVSIRDGSASTINLDTNRIDCAYNVLVRKNQNILILSLICMKFIDSDGNLVLNLLIDFNLKSLSLSIRFKC